MIYHQLFKFSLNVWVCILLLLIACESPKEQTKDVNDSSMEEVDSAIEESGNSEKVIVFFGNSLTAGYQLELSQAFPALIQNKLDSLDLAYKVVNAGVSGETTAGGKTRVDWVLRQAVDIFVLELGGNDGLRGIPLEETKSNLQAIIDKVKAEKPEARIVLAGMQIPTNLGQEYTQTFKDIFPALAQKNDLPLIPFLLEGVAGDPNLNLPDGIHPNEEGQKIVAENVWQVLQETIGE